MEDTEADVGLDFGELWPLQLINPIDSSQMSVLFKLLRALPHAIHHYLEQLVFPLTMQHQSRKLAANGQDLGSSALFGRRFGFSGTPSDLLPRDFGPCEYQRGDDANIVTVLSSPTVVSSLSVPLTSVNGLLDGVANADPPYHTLIDSGALITGMSNVQVPA